MANIRELRQQIDAVDSNLVDLLNKRAKIAQEIGRLKAANKIPVRNASRERQVMDRTHAANKGPLPDSSLTSIFQAVITACRNLEIE